MNLKRQIQKLLLLEGFWSFRLGGSVWVLLLSLRGFSLAQIGLAEGFFHLVSLCGELPSGLCADLLGRRRTLAASQCAFVISSILMLCSAGMGGVLASMAFSALGYNMASGTREAITYDSLLQAGAEGEYLRLSARQNIVYRLAAGGAMLCAGLAVTLGYRLSYGVDVLLSLSGVAVALSLAEPEVTAEQGRRTAQPLRDLRIRMEEYIRASVRFLKSSPASLGLMLFNALVGAFATLLGFYLQNALAGAGISPAALGPLLVLVGLGGAAGSRLSVSLGRLPCRTAGVFCVCGVAAGVAMAASGQAVLMAAGGFLAAASNDALELLSGRYLNDRFPSDQRATLVSVSSLCFSLVMVVLSPIMGALIG